MESIRLYLLLTLMLIACNDTDSHNNVNHESEEAKAFIIKANDEIERWYREKKTDSLLTHMSDNVIQFPPHNKPLMGKDSIKKYWDQLLQFGNINFSLHTNEVTASGPLAIEWGTYELAFIPSENSPIPQFQDRGNYLVYWKKQNDEWKIVWDAPVSTLPQQ